MDHQIRRREALIAGTTTLFGLASAGCLGDDGDDETPTPEPFAIDHVRVVDEQPDGYRDYVEVADGVFGLDDVVWFYLEPIGIETESANAGEVNIDLDATIEVYDPSDERLMDDTTRIDRTIAEASLDELYLYFFFGPPLNADPGSYRAELQVTDSLSGESESTSVTFELSLDETDVDAHFTSYLSENLDIEVTTITSADRTVILHYDSSHQHHDDGGFDIGFIAGAFSRYIVHGWDVDILEVEVTYGDGSTYGFWIEATDAMAFAEGTLSEEAYIDSVFETVERLDE